MSPDEYNDEYRSALAVMSYGERQDACEHRAKPNKYGECSLCGAWLTSDGEWL